MVDMATILREQIYSAVRAFTCATVAEAEACDEGHYQASRQCSPDDGTCVRCGAAPRNETGLCATCRDEDTCRERRP